MNNFLRQKLYNNGISWFLSSLFSSLYILFYIRPSHIQHTMWKALYSKLWYNGNMKIIVVGALREKIWLLLYVLKSHLPFSSDFINIFAEHVYDYMILFLFHFLLFLLYSFCCLLIFIAREIRSFRMFVQQHKLKLIFPLLN